MFKEKLQLHIPTSDEVNEFYQATQRLAGEYDYAIDCLGEVSDELIEELSSANQDFLDAVNARRAVEGKIAYKDIDDLLTSSL